LDIGADIVAAVTQRQQMIDGWRVGVRHDELHPDATSAQAASVLIALGDLREGIRLVRNTPLERLPLPPATAHRLALRDDATEIAVLSVLGTLRLATPGAPTIAIFEREPKATQ
jgi:hypothetical protein